MSIINLLFIIVCISSSFSNIIKDSELSEYKEELKQIFYHFQFIKSNSNFKILSYTFNYNEIIYLPINCSNISKTNESKIILENCTMTIFSKLKVVKDYYCLLYEENDIVDLNITNITFKKEYDRYSIVCFNYSSLKLNKYKPYYHSSLFQLENKKKISTLRAINFIINLKYFLLPGKITKKDEVNAILALLIMNEPYYANNIHKKPSVTYFTYLNSKSGSYVNTRDFVRMTNLIIKIEYSIEYDLNYKEGLLIIDNCLFKNKDFEIDKNNIKFYYSSHYDHKGIQHKELEDFFVGKFMEDLKKTIRNYYSNNQEKNNNK